MFKKYIKKLVPAVLLTLTVALLLGFVAVSVSSANAETKNLTVYYDASCSVVLTVNGEEQSKVAAGAIIEIPYPNDGVSVSVKPNSGYDIDAIYEVVGDVETKLDIATVNRRWSTEFFNRDVTLKITCKPKTYKIEFLPEAGATEFSYEFFGSNMPTGYTYKGSPVIIGPVRKNSGVKDAEGYVFKGWEVVHKESDGTIKTIGSWSLDSEQNCEIGSDITVFDEWQESGVIYLRPCFEPKNYPVWRYDYVIANPDNLANPGWKLWLNEKNPSTWEAPMASEITGNWADGEVSPYPGYKFFGYTTHRVTMDENNEKKNVVYRYFLPIEYELIYDNNGGELTDPEAVFSKKHVFDQPTQLPLLKREGYTFVGWSVLVNGTEVQKIETLENLCLGEGNEIYAIGNSSERITLRAIWKSNEYDVTYDLGGADPSQNTFLPTKYTYDSALQIPVPVRRGYEFLGWSVNGSDTLITDLTLAAETYSDTVHLRAAWKALELEVKLDSNGGLPAGGSMLPGKVVYDSPLNTDGIALPTRSQYKFLGFFYGDVQYIKADGSSACEKWDLVSEDGSSVIVLKAKWELLPVTEVDPDSYQIDYKNEKFQFPQGSYKLTFGDITVEFTVDADGMGAKKIPEEFFGETVNLTVFTPDDTLYSDYCGTLTVVPRPEAPTRENNVIDQVFSTNTTIQVLFKEGIDSSLYETALYLDGKSVVAWGDTLIFDGLKEGTSYVVLVRVKATDAAPCSSSTQFDRDTDSKGFKESLRKELDSLIQPGDGEMVNDLISQAKNAIDELKHSATFYEDAQRIVENASVAIKFARRQDQRIADLRSYHDALLDTKAYSQSNQALIGAILANAQEKIQSATDDAAVQAIYEAAYREMAQIKISYLRNEDVFITIENGLPKEYTVTLVRHPDFTTQAEQVDSSIVAGKVFGFGGDSPADLIHLLKTQDVMAAYTMSLSGTDHSGVFKVTLHLPAELRGVSGLRVAYFDKTTGTLEVLCTETEGDYLVFYAERISDFVILGDPVLNLLIPMIALFIVVICQLIAIALILKGRADSKKAVRHYSFVLPVALTIQFLPKHGEWIVLILGALVILLQIVLTVLLLKSEVIHKKRLKRGAYKPLEEPSVPVMASAETLYEEPAAEDVICDQAPETEASGEEDSPFYYASVNTETEFEEHESPYYEEASTYSLDTTTGELYEDPYGEYTEEALTLDETEPEHTEASSVENENGMYVVSEDQEAPFFAFDDEDVVYGDPAEPPYEDDAVTDEPEERIFDIGQSNDYNA